MHQGTRRTWERVVDLIGMAECFKESPVNCIGPFAELWGDQGNSVLWKAQHVYVYHARAGPATQRCSGGAEHSLLPAVVHLDFAQRNSIPWPWIPLQMCCWPHEWRKEYKWGHKGRKLSQGSRSKGDQWQNPGIVESTDFGVTIVETLDPFLTSSEPGTNYPASL